MPSLRSMRRVDAGAMIVETGDNLAQRGQRLAIGTQCCEMARQSIKARVAGEVFRFKPPQIGERGVEQLEPPISAKHSNAFFQAVERFALHANEGVELAFQMEAFADIIKQISHAAWGLGLMTTRKVRLSGKYQTCSSASSA